MTTKPIEQLTVSELSTRSKFLLAMLTVPLDLAEAALTALVLGQFWIWFLAKQFNIPSFPFIVGVGAVWSIRLLTGKPDDADDQPAMAYWSKRAANGIIRPFTYLLLGWVFWMILR